MPDAKLILFQQIAKMMGVSPEMLMHVMQTISEAGERLDRIEQKLDFLVGGDNHPGLAGPQPGDGDGHVANGAGRRL